MTESGKIMKNLLIMFSSYLLSDSRLHGTFYNSKRYLEDEHNRKVYSYVMQERLLENHSYLYSTKKHMELFYASLFWNSFHTLAITIQNIILIPIH